MDHLTLGPPDDPWDGSDWPEVWNAGLEKDALDLGGGVTARRLLYGAGRVWIGLVEEHTRPDGQRCAGYLLFRVPEADEYAARFAGATTQRWDVPQWEPLTITPS